MQQDLFNKLFEGLTADNFQEKVLNIKDTLSKENALLEQSYETIKQKDLDIAQLRDTNQRLFLRVSESTANPINSNSADSEPELTLSNILDNISKGE